MLIEYSYDITTFVPNTMRADSSLFFRRRNVIRKLQYFSKWFRFCSVYQDDLTFDIPPPPVNLLLVTALVVQIAPTHATSSIHYL